MIVLEEFMNMLFCMETASKVYVYDDETSLDDKARGEYPEMLFTLHSCLRPSAYLLPQYTNAEVRGFYALGRGEMAIWIEPRKGQK